MTEVDERCPGCGATARADAGWCSLCFEPLRPEPGSARERPDEPELLDVRRAPWGRHARPDEDGTDSPAHDGDAPAADPLLVDAMLARLAAESDDPLGGLAGRLDSSAAKAVAITVGVLVMIIVIIALMFGLGSLL